MPPVTLPEETRACFFPSPGEKDVAMEIADCIASLPCAPLPPTPCRAFTMGFFPEITDASEETQTSAVITRSSHQLC